MANSWYIYNGVGDPYVPSSYNRTTINPTCIDGCRVCAIYILGDTADVPTNPLSSNIRSYITHGIATQARKPSGVGQKPYVYLFNC